MELRDTANWSGITLVSANVARGFRKPEWIVDGNQYVTEEEAMLARMLIRQGISFTPNVSISIIMPHRASVNRRYVPDFVFDGFAYVWTEPHGAGCLVHGLEAKGNKGGFAKIERLFEQRGISVFLLRNPRIRALYAAGTLPLRRFTP